MLPGKKSPALPAGIADPGADHAGLPAKAVTLLGRDVLRERAGGIGVCDRCKDGKRGKACRQKSATHEQKSLSRNPGRSLGAKI